MNGYIPYWNLTSFIRNNIIRSCRFWEYLATGYWPHAINSTAIYINFELVCGWIKVWHSLSIDRINITHVPINSWSYKWNKLMCDRAAWLGGSQFIIVGRDIVNFYTYLVREVGNCYSVLGFTFLSHNSWVYASVGGAEQLWSGLKNGVLIPCPFPRIVWKFLERTASTVPEAEWDSSCIALYWRI